MPASLTRTFAPSVVCLTLCVILAACSVAVKTTEHNPGAETLNFGPEQRLGDNENNPSTPFLRYSPDGRLFAIWTEDHDTPWPQGITPQCISTWIRRQSAIAHA